MRQWFIRILLDQAKVPQTMMRVEAGMKFGQEIGSVGGTSRKTYRADILVYDRSLKPLLVVECKREDVPITEEVLLQALRYNSVLGVRFLVLTNGQRTVICSLGKDGATYLQALPSWEEMISSPV